MGSYDQPLGEGNFETGYDIASAGDAGDTYYGDGVRVISVSSTSTPNILGVNPNPYTTPQRTVTDQFTSFTPSVVTQATCFDHELSPDTVVEHDDGFYGFCSKCSAGMMVPRIPGGVSFDRAGNLIGRAMSADEEDALGELLAELNLFEQDVQKEIAKYKRVLGLLKIARDIAHNRAIEEAKDPIG